MSGKQFQQPRTQTQQEERQQPQQQQQTLQSQHFQTVELTTQIGKLRTGSSSSNV